MNEDVERIERPIPTQTNVRLEILSNCTIQRAWSFLPIRRFWTAGYNQIALSRWFDMIPADISILLQRILARVEEEMLSRIMHLKVLDGLRTQASKDRDDVMLVSEQSIWDGDETCPHMAIQFDPVTQQSTNIYANHKLTDLLGLHIEEFLSRSAAQDLGIPVPPEDFLYFIIDDILNIPINKKETYHRVLSSSCSKQGTLAVMTMIKTFNAVGEITQVPTVPWL
jgi:hypothetical protein